MTENEKKLCFLIAGDLQFLKEELKERLNYSDPKTDSKTRAIKNRIVELGKTLVQVGYDKSLIP